MPVKGVSQVKRNFRKLMEEIAGKTTDTAVYAIMSQGMAMAATMTPIDTSTLINSHFVYIDVEPGKIVGRTGYTAAYAAAVHAAEGVLKGQPRPDNRGDFWDPNAEPQFLSKGFEEIIPNVPAILRRHYRV